MMAWADLYIRLRSVCPTWADISKSFLEYRPSAPQLDHLANCKLFLANNERCARRYRRWYSHAQNAPWARSADPLDCNETAKSHCVGHMMSFQSIMGPVDQARLGNFEHDHIYWVKLAILKTRQHENTQMQELQVAVNRMDAVRVVVGSERGPCMRGVVGAEWAEEALTVGQMYFYIWPNELQVRCRAAHPQEVPSPPLPQRFAHAGALAGWPALRALPSRRKNGRMRT